MTEKSLSRMLGRYFGPKLQQHYRKAEILGFAALCFLASASGASAADTLKNVSFQALPGGAVELWSIIGGRHVPAPADFSPRTIDWLLAHPKP